MSWNVSHTGPARDAHARHDALAEAAKAGRNGYEVTAIDATKAAVERCTRHAQLTEQHVTVSSNGHHDDAGLGGFSLSVSVHAAPEPVED